jgi:hypothetical protein
MAVNILRLTEQGRRLYEMRRTCPRSSDSTGSQEPEKRRLYVDGKSLRRASSSYVQRHNALRLDTPY